MKAKNKVHQRKDNHILDKIKEVSHYPNLKEKDWDVFYNKVVTHI